MVDFLGSYCEVPLEDEDFQEDQHDVAVPLQSSQKLFSSSPISGIVRSQSQIDEEEYLSSRPASRVNRHLFQTEDCNESQAEEVRLSSEPHLRLQGPSYREHESPGSSLTSPASAPDTEHDNTKEEKERDLAKEVPAFDKADEEEEFNPVSVASMSMFGGPQSMVTLQLKQPGSRDDDGAIMSRLQELAKLASANKEPHSPMRTLKPEKDSLFGSSARQVADNQSQADDTRPESAKSSRGFFRVFRRRQDAVQQVEDINNLPSPEYTPRSRKHPFHSKR